MATKPNARQLIGAALAGVLALLMMGAPVAGSPAKPRATLSAQGVIVSDAPLILLGQILTIDTPSVDLQSRLAGVRIGRAAPAGQTRTISREYILLRLRQSGFDPAHFDIRLPSKIQVQRSAIRISREEMEMMIRDHLQTTPPSHAAQVNIKAVRIKEDVLLPKGRITHEIQIPHQSAPSRMLPVAIAFQVDGRLERKVSALVSLEVIQKVVVSRRKK